MSIRHRGNFYLSLFHLLDLVIYSEEALLWNFTSRRILFNRQNSLRTPPKERPRPIVSLCNWVGSICGMMDPSDYLRPPAPLAEYSRNSIVDSTYSWLICVILVTYHHIRVVPRWERERGENLDNATAKRILSKSTWIVSMVVHIISELTRP